MRKYGLPPTSDEYLRYTPEELIVEFFEDYFESHPAERLERQVHEASGQPYFVTGDPLIDKWEREIAEGREPDLDEALTPAQRETEESHLARLRAAAGELEGWSGLEERFDG